MMDYKKILEEQIVCLKKTRDALTTTVSQKCEIAMTIANIAEKAAALEGRAQIQPKEIIIPLEIDKELFAAQVIRVINEYQKTANHTLLNI